MKWIVGIDEVGRGPLAGPVTVCAVAMPNAVYKKKQWSTLNDSKKMTVLAREKWYMAAQQLGKNEIIRYAISSRSAARIDKKGIAACIRECIADNLKKIMIDPKDCVVLLDGGLKAPAEYKHQQTIIRGDGSEKIISLASVIAKVSRDRYMATLHKKSPQYAWDKNKGYGTIFHRSAIKKYGTHPVHRMSFLKKILS